MCCWYEWLYSLAVLTVMTAAVPFSAVDACCHYCWCEAVFLVAL